MDTYAFSSLEPLDRLFWSHLQPFTFSFSASVESKWMELERRVNVKKNRRGAGRLLWYQELGSAHCPVDPPQASARGQCTISQGATVMSKEWLQIIYG